MTPPVEARGADVRVMGQGAQPALLIHCSLAHSGAWTGLAERLGDRLTMTAYDLPGHGRAPDWVPGTDMAEVAVARGLSLMPPGQSDVIGHSFGAVVALRLALEAPERVRRLVLIEPTFFAAAARDGAPEFPEHLEEMRPVDTAFAAGDMPRAAELFTAIWGTGQPWSALSDAARAYITERIALIPAAFPVLHGDSGHLLDPGRLEGLERPVLLLGGSESPSVVGAIGRALAGRLPQARRAEVPGARHMLPITHPDAAAGLLRAFLAD